jgi:hypothetical protein
VELRAGLACDGQLDRLTPGRRGRVGTAEYAPWAYVEVVAAFAHPTDSFGGLQQPHHRTRADGTGVAFDGRPFRRAAAAFDARRQFHLGQAGLAASVRIPKFAHPCGTL